MCCAWYKKTCAAAAPSELALILLNTFQTLSWLVSIAILLKPFPILTCKIVLKVL